MFCMDKAWMDKNRRGMTGSLGIQSEVETQRRFESVMWSDPSF